MGIEVYFQTVGWITNIITTLAASKFTWDFLKLKEKTSSHYMILILTLSDFGYPLKTMLDYLLIKDLQSAYWMSYVGTFVFQWSLYWSTIIAIFTYTLLAGKSTSFCPRNFMKKSVWLCTLLAFACPLMIMFKLFGVSVRYLGPGLAAVDYPLEGALDKILYFVFFNLIAKMIPIIIITWCYLKVGYIVRTTFSYAMTQSQSQFSAFRIFGYIFIPMLCFLPGILADIVCSYQGTFYPLWAQVFVYTVRRSWPFLNIMAYWFLTSFEAPEEDDNNSVPELCLSLQENYAKTNQTY